LERQRRQAVRPASLRLILASASPRRAAILSGAGFRFRIVSAAIDETRRRGETAEVYVRRLALEKARVVVERVGRGGMGIRRGVTVVIGADTAVVVGKEIWGKPKSAADARRMLRRLSGRAHQVFTGVALIAVGPGHTRDPERVFVEKTRVEFAKLSDKEIEDYVRTREPFDKAGAYGIQGLGSKFVSRIEGCYFNVMGLPVARVDKELKSFTRLD
jgi:septum formation protein